MSERPSLDHIHHEVRTSTVHLMPPAPPRDAGDLVLPTVEELPQQRVAPLTEATTSAAEHVEPVPDLSIVIPALNEARRLPRTLDAVAALLDQVGWEAEVLVVDNGSVDRTAELVVRRHDPRFSVVGCRTPGKGAAVRRGFEVARAPRVGFMDADLATPVEYLLPALHLLDHGADAVIASRTVAGAGEQGRSHLRRLASHAFRRSRPTLVSDFVDTQCGFKFFRAEVAREAFRRVRCDGFTFDVELLARVVQSGATVTELPVSWTAVEGSTFSPLRHGLSSLVDLARVRRDLARGDG